MHAMVNWCPVVLRRCRRESRSPMGRGCVSGQRCYCCTADRAFDHSMFKPTFAPLAEVAQLIYLDHRGQRAQRARRPCAVDARSVGRRRASFLRRTRHREADGTRLFIRWLRRAVLCNAPSRPSCEACALQHHPGAGRRAGARRVGSIGGAECARSRRHIVADRTPENAAACSSNDLDAARRSEIAAHLQGAGRSSCFAGSSRCWTSSTSSRPIRTPCDFQIATALYCLPDAGGFA